MFLNEQNAEYWLKYAEGSWNVASHDAKQVSAAEEGAFGAEADLLQMISLGHRNLLSSTSIACLADECAALANE